jgi:hypothetical protein
MIINGRAGTMRNKLNLHGSIILLYNGWVEDPVAMVQEELQPLDSIAYNKAFTIRLVMVLLENPIAIRRITP